jgi:hypothetical protein
MSGADAFATNTMAHTADTPQLLLDHHLQDCGCFILREHKVTQRCAVELVDSGSRCKSQDCGVSTERTRR